MATSEMFVDDYNRENNMNKVANGESCHLLASEQVKETDCFFMPPPPKLSNSLKQVKADDI